MAMQAKRPPKAYSYLRFSTPEQAKGDSAIRQTQAAQRWCERHGIELDTELTFSDEGVSAFEGANIERGLGAFLRAIQNGEVPKGSYLLVESLDRISRQSARRAARSMEDIVERGITVVDLSDGEREYSAAALDKDPLLMVMMVLRFTRAHEESALKSVRVAAARERGRQKFASNEPLTKPLTRQLPGWLRWNDITKSIEAIPERAKVIRKIFKLADSGMGQHSIAGWLNENAGEPWGRGKRKGARWHRSYVQKILTNPAVVGTFTPHKIERDPETRRKTRKPLNAIHHRFPAVVDRELFERVSSRIGSTAPRGRQTRTPTRSIFAGVLKCRHCGGTVTRVAKGDHVYLVCSAANARPRSCHYEALPYDSVERAFINAAQRMIDEAPRGNDTTQLDAQIASTQAEAAMLTSEVQDLLTISIEEKSAIARRNLKQREQDLADTEERLQTLKERRDSLAKVGVRRRLDAIERALHAEPLDRPKANAALREAVERIVIFAAEGRAEVHWRHASEPQDTVLVTRRFEWGRAI
jgi:DNA invertase Pin-like site-specific DNA recombinase